MDKGPMPRKRVLVVDDDPLIGKIVALKLKLCGYDVITTTSGEQGIQLVQTHKPDLMLLDILMPGLTGFEVLERVRPLSQMPVVVFTARDDIAETAKQMGASGAIAKPFDPDRLVEEVRTLLGDGESPAACQ